MKKLIAVTALMAVFLVNQVIAQTAPPLKVKEYGLGLTGLNGFSLQYRWGNEQRLYRITGQLSASSAFSAKNTQMNYNDSTRANQNSTEKQKGSPTYVDLGFGFSILHLKSVSDKFGFIYGPTIGLNGGYNRTESLYYLGNFSGGQNYQGTQIQYRRNIMPYVGVVLGAMYKINSNFFLYGEIAPSLFYNFTRDSYRATAASNSNVVEQGYTQSNSFGFGGISNSGAMLTLVYRITQN
jgi:hypothetical protein